jgi:hypothetical protein
MASQNYHSGPEVAPEPKPYFPPDPIATQPYYPPEIRAGHYEKEKKQSVAYEVQRSGLS